MRGITNGFKGRHRRRKCPFKDKHESLLTLLLPLQYGIPRAYCLLKSNPCCTRNWTDWGSMMYSSEHNRVRLYTCTRYVSAVCSGDKRTRTKNKHWWQNQSICSLRHRTTNGATKRRLATYKTFIHQFQCQGRSVSSTFSSCFLKQAIPRERMDRERAAWHIALYLSSMDLKHDSWSQIYTHNKLLTF